MINPVRRHILKHLERLSELASDFRFGQLVANPALLAAGPSDETLWNLEVEQIFAAIRQHISNLETRQQSVG